MNLKMLDGGTVELKPGSNKEITFQCDGCKVDVIQIYKNYLKQNDGYYCRKCRNKHTANRSDVKEKQSVATKEKWQNDEHKVKMSKILSESCKKSWSKRKTIKDENMTAEDNKNIQLIIDFLNEESIPFSRCIPEDDTTQCIFTIKGMNDNTIEIRYVNSFTHKMDYEKRFGIKGIQHDYFINISHKNYEDGIRTIWIKDFEITNNKTIKGMDNETILNYHRKWEVLKSYIRTATGHIRNRIYARDCEIKIVPNSELRPFLELNCFYGYRAANKNIGLYLKKDKCGFKSGTLLYVYTFGSAFYDHNKPGQLEVIRVATVLNTQVIGGASKCIKYFLVNYPEVIIGKNIINVETLLFYVDADHNSSQSMETLGFDFVSWKGSGFMNVNVETGEIFQRKPMIHKQIMKWMSEGKIYSVSNAGTIVYTLNRSKWMNERLIAEQKKRLPINEFFLDINNNM